MFQGQTSRIKLCILCGEIPSTWWNCKRQSLIVKVDCSLFAELNSANSAQSVTIFIIIYAVIYHGGICICIVALFFSPDRFIRVSYLMLLSSHTLFIIILSFSYLDIWNLSDKLALLTWRASFLPAARMKEKEISRRNCVYKVFPRYHDD